MEGSFLKDTGRSSFIIKDTGGSSFFIGDTGEVVRHHKQDNSRAGS